MNYKYLINTGNFGFLDEVYEIRILLCYLLKHCPRALTHDQLVEIATKNDIVNYFYLEDAISGLVSMEYATYDECDDKNSYYHLTEKGDEIAVEFRKYIPRALRDKILAEAAGHFAKINHDKEVKCDIKKLESGGFEVHFILLSENCTLADVKLFAPDASQANYFKNKISDNASEFYLSILNNLLDGYEDAKANENPLEFL